MKLASFYKNNLVPSYDRIKIVTEAIQGALTSFYKEESPDPELTNDSRPYVRRQEVMNSIIKTVKGLPRDWKMSVKKKRAGGNFNYVLVRFEDLNINLIPIHMISHVNLPRPSGYRGDMSAFNFAVMKDHGMQAELDFQTHMVLEKKDIPFGLLLIYDGTNMKAPLRLAALTPEQDRFIFCDNVELLKECSGVAEEAPVQVPVEKKKRRKVKLNTSQVKEYNDTPKVAMKKDENRQEK
jgi:hypothetical protein